MTRAKDLFPDEEERKLVKWIIDLFEGKLIYVIENDEIIFPIDI